MLIITEMKIQIACNSTPVILTLPLQCGWDGMRREDHPKQLMQDASSASRDTAASATTWPAREEPRSPRGSQKYPVLQMHNSTCKRHAIHILV